MEAIGYTTGTILSLLGLWSLRRVQTVEQARPLLELLELSGPIFGISLLTIAAGLYMTATQWGWQTGWINVSLGGLVLLFAFGA